MGLHKGVWDFTDHTRLPRPMAFEQTRTPLHRLINFANIEKGQDPRLSTHPYQGSIQWGRRGGSFSPKMFSFPPKPFAIINCLILKCAILSKILVECYMKTAKNGQCACMRQHFSPKPKFLDRTLLMMSESQISFPH